MKTKVLTVRLPEGQLNELETLARFDGVALAEEIREGVELLLNARRHDPAYRERVRESFEHARRLLAELEGTEAVVEALETPAAAEEPATVLWKGAEIAAAELAADTSPPAPGFELAAE